MCGNQRVDHDPKAAVELPEDVGVRHGVACARKAAPSVRVGGWAARGAAVAWRARTRGCAPARRLSLRWPLELHPLYTLVARDTGIYKGVPGFPLVPPSAMCATTPTSAVALGMHSNPRHCASTCTSPTRPVSLSPLLT